MKPHLCMFHFDLFKTENWQLIECKKNPSLHCIYSQKVTSQALFLMSIPLITAAEAVAKGQKYAGQNTCTYRIQCHLGCASPSSPCISHAHALLYSAPTQRPPRERSNTCSVSLRTHLKAVKTCFISQLFVNVQTQHIVEMKVLVISLF